MSVEAYALMGDDWARWQGHLVNGVYPLGRILGHSDHSAVFLTRSRDPQGRDVAIKLVPAGRSSEALQRAQWTLAGAQTHPNLLPLKEWGTCQLDDLSYHYVVMEHADQTLAQLLLRRALSGEEAREMLQPILAALQFLHGQGLVQGQLKPTNVLVVGDELKLASDTIRRMSDEAPRAPTAYDAPNDESKQTSADDVWALGISLFEALTRRPLPTASGLRNGIMLPADFPPDFREIVNRCLSPRAQDRPTVAALQAFANGQPLPAVTVLAPPAALPAPRREPQAVAAPPPPSISLPDPIVSAQDAQPALKSSTRAFVAAMLATAVLMTLGWTVVPLLRGHAAPEAAADSSSELVPLIAGGQYLAATPRVDTRAPSVAPRTGAEATQPAVVHAVIPTVAKSAARTIRGHVEVTVRATLKPDGSVATAAAERGAPSRYFQRLSVESARKWTFSPGPATPARAVQIVFEFTRDGATAHPLTSH